MIEQKIGYRKRLSSKFEWALQTFGLSEDYLFPDDLEKEIEELSKIPLERKEKQPTLKKLSPQVLERLKGKITDESQLLQFLWLAEWAYESRHQMGQAKPKPTGTLETPNSLKSDILMWARYHLEASYREKDLPLPEGSGIPII